MSKFNQAQSQNRQSATQGGNGQEYFDLHVRGCGFLNRVRWVRPKGKGRQAEPFLACAINAMHGPVVKPNYSYMDLRVSGEEAISIVDSLAEAVDAKKKVFVAFRVGDIYAHAYERPIRNERGEETGAFEPAAVVKGRLLLITCAKVDGEVVYQLEEGEGDGAQPEPEFRQGGARNHYDEDAQQEPQGAPSDDDLQHDDHPGDDEQQGQQRSQRFGRGDNGNRFSGRGNVSQGRFGSREQSSQQGGRSQGRSNGRTGTHN